VNGYNCVKCWCIHVFILSWGWIKWNVCKYASLLVKLLKPPQSIFFIFVKYFSPIFMEVYKIAIQWIFFCNSHLKTDLPLIHVLACIIFLKIIWINSFTSFHFVQHQQYFTTAELEILIAIWFLDLYFKACTINLYMVGWPETNFLKKWVGVLEKLKFNFVDEKCSNCCIPWSNITPLPLAKL